MNARARAVEALHRARMQRAELALELELEPEERTQRALEAVVDLAELLCDRLELVLELLPITGELEGARSHGT